MATASRHRINAVICLLVVAHAIYRFATDDLEPSLNLRTGLVVAEGVLGLAGAAWFWSRSRGAA
jgi:hypothetical protein